MPEKSSDFEARTVLSMPLERPRGIRFGDRVIAQGMRPSLPVGSDLLGPRDRWRRESARCARALSRRRTFGRCHGRRPQPLARTPIREPLGCGIRAIDGMVTCGRGQRVGIFGGSGVGKSTLIGMMARGTSADLTVVGAGGRARPRSARISGGRAGRRRAGSDPCWWSRRRINRRCCASARRLTATAVAEYFCSHGQARFAGGRFADAICHGAARNRAGGGRAAHGEGLHAFGFFAARATDRTRRAFRRGKHHGVLYRADGRRRPAGSAGRCGARAARWAHRARPQARGARTIIPPISVLDSLSRLMPAVCSREHLAKMHALSAVACGLLGLGGFDSRRRVSKGRRPGARPRPRSAAGASRISAAGKKRPREFSRNTHAISRIAKLKRWLSDSHSTPCCAFERASNVSSNCGSSPSPR